MKKIIYSTLLLSLLSQLIFSQNVAQIVSNTLPHSNNKLSVDALLKNRSKNIATQEDKGWRIGIQFGNCGNSLKYNSGMQIANARFKQKNFRAPSINLAARYDFNKHWMIMSGVGFNAIGFGYSISENYSLLNTKNQASDIKTGFAALEFPVSLFYKFNLNCKNTRWIVEAGFVPTFIGKQNIDKNFSISNEGNSANYLKSQSISTSMGSVLLRYSVGREKVFRNGSILQVNLLFNVGLNTLATSTVYYTIDNQNYTHTFSNNGSSVGIKLAYFLKPLGK
jgi:hypothetical protein